MPFLLDRRALLAAAALAPLAASLPALAADPIRIGMVVPLTGPAAESGQYAQYGAKLALEEVNAAGGVMGRPLEIVTADDQTTNPGAVLAFSKLAGDSSIAAFVGSIRSTQNHAMAPDILKTAKPVMFGGTDPTLTHMNNPWLFRCRPNDSFSGRVIADFGVNTLKKKSWVVVHSTDAFGTNGMKALVEALKSYGVEPKLVQGYANQTQDFTPVVLAVKGAAPDVLSSYFTFETDLGIFAKQLRQLGMEVPWVGSPSIVNVSALKLAGAALNGSYGVADFVADSSPEAKAFATKYKAAYKLDPDNQSSWTYDAVKILALAMNTAKTTEAQAVRKAIVGIQGFHGAEGIYNFDENGDGLRGYSVVRNDNGNIVFDKYITFDK